VIGDHRIGKANGREFMLMWGDVRVVVLPNRNGE